MPTSGNAVALVRRLGVHAWRVPLGGLSRGRIAHELSKLGELLLRESCARRSSDLTLLSGEARTVCTGVDLPRATGAALRGKVAKFLAFIALHLRLIHAGAVGCAA